MARDRNVYVWQAYVIVMSIVSVVCMGALMFVVFKSGTNAAIVEGALAREQKAIEEQKKTTNARQILERILGVGTPLSESEFNQLRASSSGDEKLNEASNVYTKNMALLGQGGGEPSYTNLVATLMKELRSRNVQVDDAAKKEIELKNDYVKKMELETKMREAEKENSKRLSNELEKALTKYAEDIDVQQKNITKIEMEKRNLIQVHDKTVKGLRQDLEKSRGEIAEMTKRVDGLVRLLNEIKGEDFQYVQGKITDVFNAGESVYISLGKADRLKVGVSFGVLDADITRVSEAKPKAKIEVVDVVSEHLSRCKVLSEKYRTVILTGDSIYSPAWQPGKEVAFALIGKMDINGDGTDDRELVKKLIQQNGGKVTADLNPKGQLVGELSVETTWLVMGDDFKVRSSELDATSKLDSATAALAKKRLELESQAKSLGITRINVDKLIGWFRGADTNAVIPLGDALQGKLEAKESNPSSGRVSELFQTRDGKKNRPTTNP